MSQRFTFLIDYDESETDITTVHVRGRTAVLLHETTSYQATSL